METPPPNLHGNLVLMYLLGRVTPHIQKTMVQNKQYGDLSFKGGGTPLQAKTGESDSPRDGWVGSSLPSRLQFQDGRDSNNSSQGDVPNQANRRGNLTLSSIGVSGEVPNQANRHGNLTLLSIAVSGDVPKPIDAGI